MAGFKLKLVSGGTTYYVTTLQQTSLNMNAVPPYINTGSLTGLTTDSDQATEFTEAQVKEAKMAYPGFTTEPFVAPPEFGIMISEHIYLGESVNGTTNAIQQNIIFVRNITTPTVSISIENESNPLTAFISVSKEPGGPYVPSIVFDVPGGTLNREFTTYFHGVSGDSINSCDLVLKDGNGVELKRITATGYHHA